MFYDPVTFQLFKPLASYLVANYAFVCHTSIDYEKANYIAEMKFVEQ